jgi:hypothetical protein
MDANGLKAEVPTGETSSPYQLIETTALRWYRRRLSDLLLPAVPPVLAAAAALAAGRLPLEIGVAGTIALAILGFYVTGLVASKSQAARFLDRSLGAKDRFLTLSTIERAPTLLIVVESSAAAIAASVGDLPLPPRRKRLLVASVALSVAGFLFLWVIPELASLAGAGGGGLDRIAAELSAGDAADQELARVLRDVSNALHDPRRSNQEKRAKIAEALAKLEQAERKRQISSAGSAGGTGEKSSQGRQQKTDGNRQEQGASGQASGQGKNQQAGGTGNGEGNARGQARQELERIAGELAGESQQAKAEPSKSTQAKPQPSGGGIQGPESGAKERKPEEREASGNQPGKAPDKSGGEQKAGGDQGETKAESGGEQQRPNAQNPGSQGGPGAGADGTGQKPSSRGETKGAERYYKPGEVPGGDIAGGQYVRVRVPEEDRALAGTEEVAKPGDVNPEVPYGNAPLPEAGSPGEVSAEQPVPLEYRDALKPPTR